jgi:hypothetical protein
MYLFIIILFYYFILFYVGQIGVCAPYSCITVALLLHYCFTPAFSPSLSLSLFLSLSISIYTHTLYMYHQLTQYLCLHLLIEALLMHY